MSRLFTSQSALVLLLLFVASVLVPEHDAEAAKGRGRPRGVQRGAKGGGKGGGAKRGGGKKGGGKKQGQGRGGGRGRGEVSDLAALALLGANPFAQPVVAIPQQNIGFAPVAGEAPRGEAPRNVAAVNGNFIPSESNPLVGKRQGFGEQMFALDTSKSGESSFVKLGSGLNGGVMPLAEVGSQATLDDINRFNRGEASARSNDNVVSLRNRR